MAELHTFVLKTKIDGQALAVDVDAQVEKVVVDSRLHLPAMFEVHFNDIDGDVLERSRAKFGSAIEISSTGFGGSAAKSVFKGYVTAFEGDYHGRGRRVILRGYDAAHVLQRGTYTRTFVNMTDADIFKKIIPERGLNLGKVDLTTVTHEHVSQAAISDWDFLKARARRCGRELTVTDGRVNFAKPTPASEAPAAGTLKSENPRQLVYGARLQSFRPRKTAGAQVPKVAVRGWDVDQKKEIAVTAETKTQTAEPSSGDKPPKLAGQVKSTVPYTAVNIPVEKDNVGTEIANALIEEIGSTFFEAEGMALGTPELHAGVAVNISAENLVASEFAGKYVLSHVRHVWDYSGDSPLAYATYFEVSGRQERSLLGLASLGQTNGLFSNSGERVYGLVVGIVTNNDDPKNMGRVKVAFPWLAPEKDAGSYESGWARVAHFGAGPKSGALFLPEVQDEVLVGFEHGDIQRPYVIGGLYNGKALPPDVAAAKEAKAAVSSKTVASGGQVKHRGFVSRMGHRLAFIDDENDPGIAIRSHSGNLNIEFKEKKGSVELRITGNPKVYIEANDELHLISKKDITIKATQNLKLEAGKDAEMKATANFKVEGLQVNVKGSTSAEVAGATTTIKGTGMVQVQAPMVKVG